MMVETSVGLGFNGPCHNAIRHGAEHICDVALLYTCFVVALSVDSLSDAGY